MMLQWFLGTFFGWMAVAAIAGTLFIGVFKGRKAAAAVALLAGAILIGWWQFLPRASGSIFGRLAAARAVRRETAPSVRPATAKERAAASKAQQRKDWAKWNRGAGQQLDTALARMAMPTTAVGGMGGGMVMPMPNVQVPNIRPPIFLNPSRPLSGGTPGTKTGTVSSAAVVTAPAPAALSANVATTATAASAKDKSAASSAGPPKAVPNATTASGNPAATGSPADSGAATAKAKPAATGSGLGKAATPKASEAANQAAQSSPPSAKRQAGAHQPSMGGSARQGGVTQNDRPSRPSKGDGGGMMQNAKTLPQRRRPHYQPTGEDAIPPVRSGKHNATGSQNTLGGTPSTSGNQPHAAQHRPRYQSTEEFVNPYVPGVHGNLPMGGMWQGQMGGHPMGGGFGPTHSGRR